MAVATTVVPSAGDRPACKQPNRREAVRPRSTSYIPTCQQCCPLRWEGDGPVMEQLGRKPPFRESRRFLRTSAELGRGPRRLRKLATPRHRHRHRHRPTVRPRSQINCKPPTPRVFMMTFAAAQHRSQIQRPRIPKHSNRTRRRMQITSTENREAGWVEKSISFPLNSE